MQKRELLIYVVGFYFAMVAIGQSGGNYFIGLVAYLLAVVDCYILGGCYAVHTYWRNQIPSGD